METVILACAAPLFLISLGVIFGRRHSTATPAAAKKGTVLEAHIRLGAAWLSRSARWLFVLAICVTAFLMLPTVHSADNLLRLMLLDRYSILAALFLTGVVPLALQAAPSLLANLFVLRTPMQLFQIVWMTIITAAMAIVTARVVELNSVDRYSTSPLFASLSPAAAAALHHWVALAALLILAIPIPFACARATKEACLPSMNWRWKPWLIAGSAGAVTGLWLVTLAAILQFVFVRPDPRAANQVAVSPALSGWPPLIPLQPVGEAIWRQLGAPQSEAFYRVADWLAAQLDSPIPNGYTVRPPDSPTAAPRLAPGHAQLLAVMTIVFLVYLGHYFAVKARGFNAMRALAIAPLYLLLLLVLMVGFFLQGASFALDRYWLPASIATLLYVYVIYQWSHTDHLFSLGQTQASGGVRRARTSVSMVPQFDQVAAAWQIPPSPRDGRKTLAVVTASGGGIQAAGWTARVLVGLHEVYGPVLTDSIKFISAVSGGSVGAMYCLDAWPPKGDAWHSIPGALVPPSDSVCGRAMSSSLEATAWGLVFPDLLRVMIPALVSVTDDRGARIEQAWRGQLTNPELRMNDLIEPVRAGAMPVPVFNATIVETGQRFVASPVLGPSGANIPPAAAARQLYDLYPDATPLVSTMVRLSATFPFVSPICRPTWYPGANWNQQRAYHFADGGYIDNEGMVTVIEWLTDYLDHTPPEARTFDRVLFLRLMPFPSGAVASAELDRGWFYATFGPIDAMANVRTASQQERNDLAVRLFTETAASRWNLEVASTKLQVEEPGASEPPLSWSLTDRQKAAINEAWSEVLSQKGPKAPLAPIDDWFTAGGSSASGTASSPLLPAAPA